MQRLLTLATLLLCTIASMASVQQEEPTRTRYKGAPEYIFRVYLTDKKNNGYSIDHPSRFLSRRSIERRKRQQLSVDSTDLPISPLYIKLLSKYEVSMVGKSRWQNTVLLRMRDTTQMESIRKMFCVKACKLVWLSPDSISREVRPRYHEHFDEHDSIPHNIYGTAGEQITSLQGDRLHKIGLLGQKMMIAVLDGGFKNTDRIPELQKINIRGYYDVVSPAAPKLFSETDHGTRVLSAMAVYHPYFFIGTAPKASYWLLRSEDQQTEQEVEEDYWTMAAEYADSVGCDIINSSLGYNEYDHRWMSHRLWHLDGRTAFVSRSASMLADKGIILCNSAGNSGMGPWKKIGVPADAADILTVGAVSAYGDKHIAPFSSVGHTQDGRIKPDVVAIGSPTRVVSGRGTITDGIGTSFSTPVVCGLVACLWQAMPNKTAREIIELIRSTSNNSDHPDNVYGYGMPNFWRAYMMGSIKRDE
ncbi:MAG: S8 family serine peptidase [Prevotella sp.]|nr:S8 family serine peptidase [Prevotella sp.]